MPMQDYEIAIWAYLSLFVDVFFNGARSLSLGIPKAPRRLCLIPSDASLLSLCCGAH